ncbi:hypothetical protein ACJVDH_06335 [Pedobacter sp. AW1-32]|uniref:hypothetical protein n=1 Tax=Pedobacter sp. AW1-32 TaxID=3383026 RepID=UPI003FF00376
MKGFIRCSPESGNPLQNDHVLTWDGIFVKQILTWYEDEKAGEKILKICTLLGFKHGEKILNSIYNVLEEDYSMLQISE